MKFKNAYSTTRSRFECKGPSMTKQSFKAQCDVNNILKKYQKTGLIEHVNQYQGDYHDLYDVVDYQTALNIVIEANDAFNSLPSSIRKKFNNSPQEFLAFVSDENNIDEMYELGIADRPDVISPEPDPQAPEVPVE